MLDFLSPKTKDFMIFRFDCDKVNNSVTGSVSDHYLLLMISVYRYKTYIVKD